MLGLNEQAMQDQIFLVGLTLSHIIVPISSY